MNDADTISENITNLVGDGSYADTKTVVVGRGEQKQNFTTEVVHWGKNSKGCILKHGVMKDVQHQFLTELEKLNTELQKPMHNKSHVY